MTLTRLQALMLLEQCTGVDIWSEDTCRRAGVPDEWFAELADCYESGFRQDDETIYYGDDVVNQYHGVHDLLLARKIATMFGVDVQRIAATAWSRQAEVQQLKEAVDEE